MQSERNRSASRQPPLRGWRGRLARGRFGERCAKGESGQALIEFVIVVPLIITIFFFAQWAWELVQIKLKLQEAARFAAWEATAYPLHNYEEGTQDGFNAMQTAVTAQTMLRYADLNSATNVPTGLTIWSATWTPPVVMLSNQQEEAIYGGAIPNLIFNIATQVGAFIAGLLYNSQNPIALTLITSSSGKSIGGGPGKALASLFGPTEWGFNRNGYIKATVATFVKNNWFNVRLLGKPIFKHSGFLITEQHGVMADSWRLNTGKDVDGGSTPGHSSGALAKQVGRMYLMTKTTRSVAKTLMAPIYTVLMGSLGQAALSPPSLNDMIKPAVVSKNYKGGAPDSGQVTIQEDIGQRKYDTAPTRGAYEKTVRDRGNHFMGCKEPEKLGCTHTLGQDNPFGDYLLRE